MNLKKSLLNFSLIIIYTIHKILVMIKSHLNYPQDNIFECFFKKHNILFLIFFSIICINEQFMF